jgi:hypothetical protein
MTAEPNEALIDRLLEAIFATASLEITRVSHRVQNGVRVDRLIVGMSDGPHHLFVKHYFGPLEAGQQNRPRLGLADDRLAKPACEYAGLEKLDALRYAGTTGVRPVRPVHYDVDERILVMEEFPSSTARERLDGDVELLRTGLRVGGAALGHAHAMPHEGPVRRQDSDAVDGDLDTLLTYVRDHRDTRTHRMIQGWWRERALSDIVCGPGHGDCSPRNLLVAENGDVAWIDGLFRYGVPVYEDLATFTTSTRTTLRMLRRHGRSPATRMSISGELLSGYSTVAGPIDPAVLSRFEVLVLLDRQASLLTARKSMRNRLLLALTDRELHESIRSR